MSERVNCYYRVKAIPVTPQSIRVGIVEVDGGLTLTTRDTPQGTIVYELQCYDCEHCFTTFDMRADAINRAISKHYEDGPHDCDGNTFTDCRIGSADQDGAVHIKSGDNVEVVPARRAPKYIDNDHTEGCLLHTDPFKAPEQCTCDFRKLSGQET